MQLFIILAGFFAELVFQRKGMNHLAKDRIKRVLIPFLVGILIFVPLLGVLTNSNPSGAYANLFDQMSWYEKFKSYFLWGIFSDQPANPEIDFFLIPQRPSHYMRFPSSASLVPEEDPSAFPSPNPNP